MDLEKHFESYRHFVKLDVLEGYADHAKNFIFEGGGDAAETLKDLKHKIELEAARKNIDQYNTHLKAHQGWVMEIFKAMVHSEFDYCILVDKKPKDIAILDMAYIKGWNWFKFLHPVVITFDKLAVVPMHDRKNNKSLYENLPVFDADEMKVVLESRISVTKADNILKIKMKAQNLGKILKVWMAKDFSGKPHFHDLETINKLSVVDWTREISYVKG